MPPGDRPRFEPTKIAEKASMIEYNRIIHQMKEYGYGEEQIYCVLLLLEDLRRFGVGNIDQFQKSLIGSMTDSEQYIDHWLEGKVALKFACNDFSVVYEPCGRSGPDLSVICPGYRFYVEITRFREDYETNKKLKERNGILVQYGRGEKDVEKLHDKIQSKVKQLRENEIGLVFLRSDNVCIEDIEFEEVKTYLDTMASQNLLTKLSGVLFDSGWIRCRTHERFYLWRNSEAERPIDDLLAVILQRLKEPPIHSRNELFDYFPRFH